MPTEFEVYLQERMGKEQERSAFELYIEERKKKEPSTFQRYVASRQELEETQKGLLAKAQEEVKWREELDTPSTWTDEVWNTVGETIKELPAAQLFTKEFWTESGKTLIKQASDFAKELGHSMATSYPIHKRDMTPEYREWYERNIERKPVEVAPGVFEEGEFGVLAAGKTVTDFVLFLPKTAFDIAKDPINTIKEKPLDVLMFVGAVAGAKAMKKIRGKAAKKKWVTTGDFVDPIVESKMVSKQMKKRLLEVPSDIELELGDVPIEIIKYKKGGIMPFLKHHWEGIKTDIKNAGDLPDRFSKYGTEKHPWLGLRIPLRTFEQYPWLKRVLYDEWRAGEASAVLESAVLTNELKVWGTKLPRKSQDRVGVYADYMQEGGAEIMQHMLKVSKKKGRNWKRFEKPELTPVEMEYYNWGQKVFADFLPRLNQIRALAGEKSIGKVQNYSTWVRNLSELGDLGIDITKATAEQIESHLNSIPLSVAKHRTGKIIKVGVELDYGKLLENYSRQATRTIHVSPSIIKSRTLLEPFRTGKGNQITWDMYKKTPKLATWLEQWTDRIAGQGKAIPKGRTGQVIRVMNKLNRNIAIAILSYNLRSALIQPSAFKNSYVYLGSKYTAKGFEMNLSKGWRTFADTNSQHLIVRKAGMGQDVTLAMMREAQLSGKVGRIKQALGQVGMFPLQWLDYQTARATWLGAYEMAIKKYGYNKKRAFTHADDVVVKTQASAQVGDISPIQGTAMGKYMTLFQTFVINDYDMLTHDVFGYKNPYMNMAQKQRNIGRYVLATAAINAFYEGILKIRSPYPTPIWTIKRGVEEGDSFLKTVIGVGKEAAEVLPLIGGMARWSTAYRLAWPAYVQKGLVDPVQMINRLAAKPKLTSDQLEWAATMLGVPGTSQAAKYFRRRKRGQTHMEALLGVRAETKKKTQPSW